MLKFLKVSLLPKHPFMKNADFKRPQLTLPNGADKLLLHSCCAPCSGEVMEAIQASGIDYTIFLALLNKSDFG